MVTGKTYREVKDYLSERCGRFVKISEEQSEWRIGLDLVNHGVGIQFDAWSYLRDMGYAVQLRYRSPYTTAYGQPLHEPWPCEPWADVHICSVESPAGAHAIVLLRDGTVLDPMTPEPRRLSDYAKVESITAVWKVVNA